MSLTGYVFRKNTSYAYFFFHFIFDVVTDLFTVQVQILYREYTTRENLISADVCFYKMSSKSIEIVTILTKSQRSANLAAFPYTPLRDSGGYNEAINVEWNTK